MNAPINIRAHKERRVLELQCMLSAHGFTDQPVGGCPLPGVTEAQPDAADVTAIVRQVVAELSRRGLM
ncbi:MAG: hypothetical protein ACKPJJ_27270 [Planctomycetaceae bacterium]